MRNISACHWMRCCHGNGHNPNIDNQNKALSLRGKLYQTLENKTPAETFPKIFVSLSCVIDRSDRNPPITATSVT